MPEEQALLVLAAAAVIALAVVAVAALGLAVSIVRLLRDLRSLVGTVDKSARLVEEELRPTLSDLRTTSANLARLSGELEPRLERVDTLLDEGEGALLSLRATVEAAEEMVRGPAAAVERARRSVRAAGHGLARGADRLRRGVEARSRRE